MINYNNRTVILKLTRREVCELLVACACCGVVTKDEAIEGKWEKLHNRINEQLNEFDEKHLEARS